MDLAENTAITFLTRKYLLPAGILFGQQNIRIVEK